MCDILPEFDFCCFCLSLRIGMLLISVLAIMTGAIGLSVIEQRTNINLKSVMNMTDIKGHEDAMKKSNVMIPSVYAFMSGVFMVTGVVLLIGTLWDVEGAVQVFVFATFINILIGFVLVMATGVECLSGKKCLLSNLDWLSGAGVLLTIVGYLFMWVYFVAIANSYVAGN